MKDEFEGFVEEGPAIKQFETFYLLFFLQIDAKMIVHTFLDIVVVKHYLQFVKTILAGFDLQDRRPVVDNVLQVCLKGA